jgi:hypothetical protein
MGDRANLLLIENQNLEIFYTRWGAITLPYDLFWGPLHAKKFFRSHMANDGFHLYDEVWAEGGAVLDFDTQVLLLFGGEEVFADIPLRRVYLDILTRMWEGWDIRWTFEGVVDIVEYVGYSRNQVLEPRIDKNRRWWFPHMYDIETANIVVSVEIDEEPPRFYPLYLLEIDEFLYVTGERLLDNLFLEKYLEQIQDSIWEGEFPEGGFHINTSAKSIELWLAWDAPDIESRMESGWPGWTFKWHRDSYEFQLDRTQGLLRFPLFSRERQKQRIWRMLMRNVVGNSAGDLDQITEKMDILDLVISEGKPS